jgi:hypothetical protein
VPVTGSGASFKAGAPKTLFMVASSRLPPHLNLIVNWQQELVAHARPPEVRSSGSAR